MGSGNVTEAFSWLSQVEIEHYSIAYFNRITRFKALQCRTSVKGRAHTHDLPGIHTPTYAVCMSPALNGSNVSKYATEKCTRDCHNYIEDCGGTGGCLVVVAQWQRASVAQPDVLDLPLSNDHFSHQMLY